ncbi:hypothetical protein C8Q72DRAFT_752532, partial [Fomitopsis betulina]
PGHVVQWVSYAHGDLLEALLPHVTEAQQSTVQCSHAFHLDRSAQLTDFAGFWVAPGMHGEADGMAYINVYSTDKSVHYQMHPGIFKKIQPHDLY